jgi:hypothetical protein
MVQPCQEESLVSFLHPARHPHHPRQMSQTFEPKDMSAADGRHPRGAESYLLIEEVKICCALVRYVAIPSTFGFILVVPLDLAFPVIVLVDLITFLIESEV